MRSLKILVVVMGVLLVGGAAALVAAVITRVERGPSGAVNADVAAPVHTALPSGSRILATELSGDRLLVRLALPDGGETLMLFNARNGAAIAVIDGRGDRGDARR
jgi:hypothetical protein